MSKDIIGQSGDNQQSNLTINGIKNIGEGIQRIANQLRNHEDRLSNMEDTMRINGVQEKKLTDNVNKVVVAILGGKKSNAYQDKSIRSKAYSEINKRIKDKFGIPRRGELPAKDYQDAIQLIDDWSPDFQLKEEIKSTNNQLELAVVTKN